jgi:hypothetical protein
MKGGERWLLYVGEHLIGYGCRRLPVKVRDERYREWTAELPAILGDPDTRFLWHRAVRMLCYSAGIAWRFGLPSRQQTRRFVAAGWFFFVLGSLAFDIWMTVRDPRDWVNYLATALAVTTALLVTFSWRMRFRRTRSR